jgi:uncharacterized protein
VAAGLTDLAAILDSLDVEVRPDSYVFVNVPAESGAEARAHAVVREGEGVTVVLTTQDAAALQLPGEPAFAWLTLTVHSSLEAVGLTATFSRALAEADISCNVLAGYFHDHLLVPDKDRDRAVTVLRSLRSCGRAVS